MCLVRKRDARGIPHPTYVALFFEVRRFEAGSAGGANWAPGGAEGGIISGQCNWGVWGASPSGVRGRALRSEK